MAYRIYALMVGSFLLGCKVVGAAEPVMSDCAHNECVVFVNDRYRAAEELCNGAAVTIRWSVGENIFLTTCEDAGTEEQSTNFLSDRAGKHARKLVYGRPILKQFLRQHPVGLVPDKFAPRPYCTPPSLQEVANSSFVLLDKLPVNTETGYCFEPTYVHYNNGQVTINTAKGKIAASNKDYFGTLPTAQEQANLAALIHRYGPTSRPAKSADDNSDGTPVPSVVDTGHRTATVSVQKATLYAAPDDTSAIRAYLVQNDIVTVLKQSPAGWAYVDYVNASGKHLLRWIKADELTIKP